MNFKQAEFNTKVEREILKKVIIGSKDDVERLPIDYIAGLAQTYINDLIRIQKDLLDAPILTDKLCPKCRQGAYELYKVTNDLMEYSLDVMDDIQGEFYFDVMDSEELGSDVLYYHIVCLNEKY